MAADKKIYQFWCDGSCYHTAENVSDQTMGMGVYYLETNPDTPVKVERNMAIAGPVGTHNHAEYLAIIASLYDFYLMVGAKRSHDPYAKRATVTIHSDSQLVVRQITGEFCARDETMVSLLEEVDMMLNMLEELDVRVRFKWNPRDTPNQQQADHLSKVGNPYFITTIADETISYMIDNGSGYEKGATSIEEFLHPDIYTRIKKKLEWMD